MVISCLYNTVLLLRLWKSYVDRHFTECGVAQIIKTQRQILGFKLKIRKANTREVLSLPRLGDCRLSLEPLSPPILYSTLVLGLMG